MSTVSGNAGAAPAWSLAFVGGYCDAASLMLVGTFTGHVTGNFVLGATKLAILDWRGASAALLAVLCFLAGIFLCTIAARRFANRPARFILQLSLGAEIVLIVAAHFLLTGFPRPGPELYLVAVSLAMGLQNGALRRVDGISVHTTYLTGMITTLIMGQSGAEAKSAASSPEQSPGWRVLGGIWISFVSGALTGAIVVSQFKAVGILGAAFLLCVILRGTTRHADQPPGFDTLME